MTENNYLTSEERLFEIENQRLEQVYYDIYDFRRYADRFLSDAEIMKRDRPC